MGRHLKGGLKLNGTEIASAFASAWGDRYPPILSLRQAAEMAHVSEKTVYDWSSRGLLAGCAVRRGKRLRIFRDRFIRFLFEGKETP
jgi:hypothetical protein